MRREEASMLPDKPTQWLALVVVCAAVTLAFMYPIWTAPRQLLTDRGDPRLNAWILAWDAHAAVTDPTTVFDANIFYPRSNALALSENLLGNMPFAAPFALAGEPVLGYNVVLLLSFFLFAVTTTLWVRYLTGSTTAGLVAGVAAAFAPSRLGHLPQIQLLATQWVPLSLLLMTRYGRTGRARHLMGVAGLVALQYWAGIQATLLFAPFVALYGLTLLFWHRPRPPEKILVHVIVAAALFTALVLPVSLPYLRAADEGMTRTLSESTQYATRPDSYMSPSPVNRMPHMLALRWLSRPEANHFAGFAVLGVLFATAGGLLAGLFRRRHVYMRPLPLLGIVLAAPGFAYALAIVAAHSRAPGSGALIAALASVAPATLFCASLVAWPLAYRPSDGHRLAPMFCLLLVLGGIGVLLSHGPVVQARHSDLGMGPFRLLHLLTPYQSIRAVGRFGLTTSLFISAAAGRRRRHGEQTLAELAPPRTGSRGAGGPGVLGGALAHLRHQTGRRRGLCRTG